MATPFNGILGQDDPKVGEDLEREAAAMPAPK